MQDGAVSDGGSDPADSDDGDDDARPTCGYEDRHVMSLLTTDSESEDEGGEGESVVKVTRTNPPKKIESCFEDSKDNSNSSSEVEATIDGGDK